MGRVWFTITFAECKQPFLRRRLSIDYENLFVTQMLSDKKLMLANV